MKQLLSSINLKKYLPFFQQSTGYPCALGLSCDDVLIQLTHEGEPEAFEILSKHIENKDSQHKGGASANQNFIEFGSEGAISTITLKLPHYERMPMLTGLLKFPADKIEGGQWDKAVNTLNKIADCIVDDYTTQQTLSDMVRELTVR